MIKIINIRVAISHPFFVLILFSISVLNANSQTIPSYLLDAYEATYKLEIYKSNEILHLNSEKKIHPVKFLIEDYNAVLELLIDENPKRFDDFEQDKDDRINQLEKLIDKKSPWYKLVKAEIKFHWGIVNFKYNNELSSAWNINQAHSLIKENQKKFPNFKPNLKTLGIFHIVIGALPDNYQWIMNKLGFKGDIGLGLKELMECSTSENLFQKESNLILTYIKAHLFNEYETSILKLKEEYAKTNNLAINYLLVSLLTNTNQSEKAIELIKKRKSSNSQVKFNFYHYKLANCYFQKGEYQKSIQEFNVFLKTYKGENYLKGTYYKIALAYYFLGNKEKQWIAFENIGEFGWTLGDEDKYAYKFYKNRKFPNKTLSKARYLSDGGYFKEALGILKENKNRIYTVEEGIELLYRKARIFDLMGDYPSAIENYKAAIVLNDRKQSKRLYYAPNSCLKLGIIYSNMKNTREAKQWLIKAIGYNNHEYENSIEMKSKSLLDKLNKKYK